MGACACVCVCARLWSNKVRAEAERMPTPLDTWPLAASVDLDQELVRGFVQNVEEPNQELALHPASGRQCETNEYY